MEKEFNSNSYVILAIVLAVFAIGFSVYGMKSDSMLTYLSSMEGRIAANAQLSPPALSPPALNVNWFVCEESDTRGVADYPRPGGTVAMVFSRNPTILNKTKLTFGYTPTSAEGDINYEGVGKIGYFKVWLDQAWTGFDPVVIEPEPTPSTPIQGGRIVDAYCNTGASGTMAAPLIVSVPTGLDALGDSVILSVTYTKRMSTQYWSLNMYGRDFSGHAHTSP